MEFPPGIANIPDGAFEGCRRLRSVKFPPGVTNIGARAFAGCVMLEGIELPAGLQSVGKGAFEGCTGLKQVALPEEVAVLDEGIFAGCDALAAISFAPGLERVGREAFLNCRSLAELLLPETVRSVHPRAFAGCSSLGAVDVAEGNPVCCSRDGVLFGDGGKELLHFPCARSGTYTVPEGVKRIGPDAFRASNVEGVRVPGSVESIGESAFRDCRSLRRVSLADGLRELGDAAFMGCRSLWELVMPGSVERTGKDLVSGCDGLLMLVVPDNLVPEKPPYGTVPANCTVCSLSEREAARQGKWLEKAHDPFYGLYTGEELDIVSFEGTVLAASAVPEPAKNDYDDCLCAILVELDSLSSQTPASKNVERVVLVNVPIMKEKTLVDQNAFEPGNKISCICTSYDAMPQAIREIQLSDDIQTFEYQQYYPLRIKSIPAFGKTGNRDFAKREITILPVRSLPRDANAAAARRERIQSEIARIESELARHGGSFDAWKEEYKSIAEKYGRLCGEGYSGWIGDSYFTAAGPETTYMTKEYIEGLLPYKKHLENNNIDLIVVRVPSRWDFAARVLGSEDFQENPAWVEHCYECLKNDIEIIDPMPEMWKERFDFPLFYFYHCPEEFHPCEGAAFVVAKETAKILERYPYQKAEPEITLRDFRFETGRAIYFWPAGNEKFDSSENLVFKQALQGGEPLGVVLDSGSPFLFFSASLFWFPQGDSGASIPAYTAYFMQTRTDWFYQRGDFNPRIKHLANSRILDSRRAVVMVGGPENWTTIPPLPRYILDGVRRIALEKTISVSSDEIAIDCKDSFSCSASENGEIHFEPNGRPTEQRADSFDICFEVPYIEGKQACMVRVNTGKISHLLMHLLDDGSDEIIDTNSFLPGNRYGADFFVPLTKPNTTVKIRFQPKNEYGVSLKNIELWYY